MIMHVYVDLDGVLADFFGGVCDLLEMQPPPAKSFDGLAAAFGLTDGELWNRIDCAGSRFWSELRPFGWNEELLGIARDIAADGVYVASSPSWHGSSAAGKMAWMQTHLGQGEPFRDFMIGTHKHLLARSRAILVDDSPAQLKEWTRAGGIGILWPQPWNSSGDFVGARSDCLSRLREYA